MHAVRRNSNSRIGDSDNRTDFIGIEGLLADRHVNLPGLGKLNGVADNICNCLAYAGRIGTPGDVQRMTAGTGVAHSEFNPSETEGGRFLQIWILPEKAGLEPGYEQKNFAVEDRADRLRLVASRNGRDGAVTIHQDAEMYSTILSGGSEVTHTFAAGRHGWVQVVRGVVDLGGETLREGDGAAISDVETVTLSSTIGAEVLLFDLA